MAHTGHEYDPPVSNSDLVCKVQTTIDYLKLCADHHTPTGEGVPVDITIMPDFVVDVDGAAIHRLNESNDQPRGRIAAAEVGSRAGRVLYILAHLRDEDDDGFGLSYIAKTGMTGRAVLQARLQRHLQKNGLQPVRFPYLVPAPQTRIAILGRDDYYEVKRHIVRPTAETLLSKSELHRHFYNPLQVIRDAKALYFASDMPAQFEELIEIAVLGKSPEGDAKGGEESPSQRNIGFRFVFVDLAAIHLTRLDDEPPHESDNPGVALLASTVEKLVKQAANGNDLAQRTFLTVIAKATDSPHDAKRLFHDRLRLRDGKDMIVAYRRFLSDGDPQNPPRDANVLWYDGIREGAIHLEVDPNRPDARDAFLAGMLLHRAVASAWSTIPRRHRLRYKLKPKQDWTKNLFPDPYAEAGPTEYWVNLDEEWSFLESHWPVSEAVQFGTALAHLWQSEPDRNIPDRRALLLSNFYDDSGKVRGEEGGDKLTHLAEDNPRDWYKQIARMEARCLENGNPNQSQGFVEHLSQIVQGYEGERKQDLLEHPEEWTGNNTEILSIASWKTLRMMLGLRTLRRLSSLKPSGFNLLNGGKGRTAYLTDLDGTLLQSSGLRSMCLRNAFLALLTPRERVGELGHTFPVLSDASLLDTLDACVESYHTFVYKQHKYWKNILEEYTYYEYGMHPKDFRQVWNHRLSYPVFLWALQHLMSEDDELSIPDSPGEIILKALNSPQILARLSTEPNERVREYATWLETRFGIEWKTEKGRKKTDLSEQATIKCHKQIANIETKYKRYFEEAAKRYWNVEYEPLRQTRECLRTLQDVLGLRLYVATEGHHETQLRKISTMRLDPFFPEMMVMSTGAAASTHEDHRNVQDERRRFREELKHYEFMEDAFRNAPDWHDKMKKQAKEANRKLQYLKLYEEQWETFEEKEDKYIYGLIVASAMVEPDNPFVGLTDLTQLVDNLEKNAENVARTRFVMIGDRERTDIKSIIDSCCTTSKKGRDRVTTVRLLTPDHKWEDLYWTGQGDPQAHYVAWTPLQVLLSVAREDAWSGYLDYHTIPAIIPCRLADEGGNIRGSVLEALVWGSGIHGEALESSISLINFLIMRSTIRDININNNAFFSTLRKKLAKSRTRSDANEPDWKTYRFILEVFNHIGFEAAYMPENKRIETAEMVRDTICDEFGARFGARYNQTDSEHERNCRNEAIEILEWLAHRSAGRKPLCKQPSQSQRETIIRSVRARLVRIRLERLLNAWKENWIRTHAHN